KGNDVVDPRQNWRAASLVVSADARGRSQLRVGPHIELRNRFDVAAVQANQPQLDIVGVIDRDIAVARDTIVTADGNSQRFGNLTRVNTERRRSRPIDMDEQLRLIEP